MKIREMSDPKKVTFILIIALGIGALFYCLFTLMGASKETRFYMILGIGTAFIFYLVSSIVKLKKDGVLYDERDDYIEKESHAISYSVFQIILLTIGLLAYTSGEITVNISGLIFLLFFIMWITDAIIRFFIKRKN